MKTFDQLIITTGFLASASPAMADEEPEADSGRPNILFILSDDHTSQAWGIYGGILSEYVKNENIRRLAAEGCVLDNCFCTNSISVPSRAAIMTGAYSHHNGVYTLEDRNACRREGIRLPFSANGISRRSRRVSTPFRFSMTRGNIGTRFSRPRRAG